MKASKLFTWLRQAMQVPSKPSRDLRTHAEQIKIDPIEGLSGAALRGTGARYDVAQEFAGYAGQLAGDTRADGTKASRSARVNQAQTEIAASGARTVLDQHEPAVEAAIGGHTTAAADLAGFVRRGPHTRRRYEMTRWILLLGDTAGIWGAAIFMGEVPALAAGQALAAGVAAVTAGQVGSDVREVRLTRQRAAMVDDGSVPEVVVSRYPRLFTNVEREATTYGLALEVALLVTVSIALSVLALRATIEGTAGLVFGGLALATAAASFINSWSYADDVADVLDVFSAQMRLAIALHAQLAANPVLASHSGALAQASSIEQEHESRASAKADQAHALKHEVYRRNPQVFGHGTTTDRPLRPAQDVSVVPDRLALDHLRPQHTQNGARP